MNMDTEYDIKRKLSKVSYNQDVAKKVFDYFLKFPENESYFLDKLEQLRWSNKFVGSFRNHISLNAILLSDKIYNQLNIITFPFIERVACKGWSTHDGTWAWSMSTVYKGNYNGDIGSADPVKYCLRKSMILEMLDSGEIVASKESHENK